MRHADLKAALPRLQTLPIEGQVASTPSMFLALRVLSKQVSERISGFHITEEFRVGAPYSVRDRSLKRHKKL